MASIRTVNQLRWRVCVILTLCLLILFNVVVVFKLLQNTEYPKWETLAKVKMLFDPTERPSEDTSTEEIVGFNISLDLGYWDKKRMFKTFHFISVGSKFIQLSQEYSVTLATQSSLDKLYSIAEVAQHWTGPISAAIYTVGDDEYFLLYIYIKFLQDCFPSVRERVGFHLTVPKDRLPTGSRPAELEIRTPTAFDCEEPEEVLKQLLKARNPDTLKWRLDEAYPQNLMRNIARKSSQTPFVFLTDVDIIPCFGFAKKIDTFLNSPKSGCTGNCAYVIPTYELDDKEVYPTTKKELIRLSNEKLARPFHEKVFKPNQLLTNLTRWEKFVDINEDIVTVSHNVTNFYFFYEPFYVAADTAPEHDERFIGYGFTRNTQAYEMHVAGFKFQVLSPIFAIHWGLQDMKGRLPSRFHQSVNNSKLVETFKKEIAVRYHSKEPS